MTSAAAIAVVGPGEADAATSDRVRPRRDPRSCCTIAVMAPERREPDRASSTCRYSPTRPLPVTVRASDTKKARNLAVNAAHVLTTAGNALKLVIEGEATAVRGDAEVHHDAEAYTTKYGWHTEMQQGGLWAHSAPTTGPPPYRAHQIKPITAFGLPTDATAVPTRWHF